MIESGDPTGAIALHGAVLRSIRRELDAVLRPELRSDAARTAAQLIDEMLATLVAMPALPSAAPADWNGERAALTALETALRAERAAADPLAAVEAPVTAAALQAYFDERGVNAGRVERVEQIAGGYSKDTWRVATSAGLAGCRRLILRRDLPFGPGENTVSDELPLLRALHAAGLPVPEPLWHEREHSPVGTPFLVFPELPGRAVFGDWRADDTLRRSVLLQLAAVMARLHAVPADALAGVPGAESARPCPALVADYVQVWQDKWRRRSTASSAIVDAAYGWLRDHLPAGPAAPSVVHSDISLRNTLIDGARLIALLDWEFAHLGDPMEDLSYFRLVAEPYIGWNEFMAAYRDAGGAGYDEQRAAYYAVWRSVRNATTTMTAWHGFLGGAYPAVKAAYQGLVLHRFFLDDIATQLRGKGVR